LAGAVLRRLIERARLLEFDEIDVSTNGTLIDDDWVQCFLRHRVCVAVSLYSYRPEIHDGITRRAGSFRLTVEGIEALRKAGVEYRLSCVVMKANEEDVPGTMELFRELGIEDPHPNVLYPVGRGRCPDVVPDADLFPRRHPGHFAEGPRETQFRYRHRYNPCWGGKLCIASSGAVYPCIMGRDWPLGNVRKQRLAEILSGRPLNDLWSICKDRIEVCRDCEYRYACDDCRVLASGGVKENMWRKSYGCTYDPYTGMWAEPALKAD
jgi:radical SAM protein with 4Fe4S-binding SPASM domain